MERKGFQCEECLHIFKSRSYLRKHLVKEHGQNQCTACGYCKTHLSKNKSDLVNHMKDDHKKEHSVGCTHNTCNSAFTSEKVTLHALQSNKVLILVIISRALIVGP